MSSHLRQQKKKKKLPSGKCHPFLSSTIRQQQHAIFTDQLFEWRISNVGKCLSTFAENSRDTRFREIQSVLRDRAATASRHASNPTDYLFSHLYNTHHNLLLRDPESSDPPDDLLAFDFGREEKSVAALSDLGVM